MLQKWDDGEEDSLEKGFSALALLTYWVWSFLVWCGGSCPVCCRMLGIIPGLYSPDASSVLIPQLWRSKISADIAQSITHIHTHTCENHHWIKWSSTKRSPSPISDALESSAPKTLNKLNCGSLSFLICKMGWIRILPCRFKGVGSALHRAWPVPGRHWIYNISSRQ